MARPNLRKGDEQTREEIASAVSQLKQDGTISARGKQYLSAL